MTITVFAAQRLKAFSATLNDLIEEVETITKKFGLKQKMVPSHPNPREYRKPAPPPYLEEVQREFEKLGFKFRKLPIHSMDTKAVESSGHYQSGEYILDLILNHDTLEVDLYY
jgi:hypothetical protein